jgi:hypothetical protein
MDILDAIRSEIRRLPDGEYLAGLQAVLTHVESASRHLARGQEQKDDSAFTDAIYRTNQAFEGSIKEAYRVLANKDPAQIRPFEIERYLEENKIFRPRILELLRTYRQSWRNPSTHDYKLDFDEDETFIAIISVAGFAKLIVSEIAERVAFEAVRSKSFSINLKQKTLPQRVGEACDEFMNVYLPRAKDLRFENEIQLIGAVAGFLTKAIPSAEILSEGINLLSNSNDDGRVLTAADIVVKDGKEIVLIEIKDVKNASGAIAVGVRQLEGYLRRLRHGSGILLVRVPGDKRYELVHHGAQFPIWSIQPKRP